MPDCWHPLTAGQSPDRYPLYSPCPCYTQARRTSSRPWQEANSSRLAVPLKGKTWPCWHHSCLCYVSSGQLCSASNLLLFCRLSAACFEALMPSLPALQPLNPLAFASKQPALSSPPMLPSTCASCIFSLIIGSPVGPFLLQPSPPPSTPPPLPPLKSHLHLCWCPPLEV